VTKEQAAAFAATALDNVRREYPRYVVHLLSQREAIDERALHPAFYGSYDWHSAVHMHWLLARLLRLDPGKKEIAGVLDAHLAPAPLAAELAYFKRPGAATFERPYGWAWLLELQAELGRLGNRAWIMALQPLAEELARRMARFIAGAPYPIRAGSHGNTAFACILALDYARAADAQLAEVISAQARAWYGADRDAPIAYEPSLDDFLSPALVEALLMKEVLAPAEFDAWLRGFLPAGPAKLAEPPRVADRADPKQAHLDGLALSRAWCLRRLGHAEAAGRLLAAALPHAAGGHYVGSHWLASFAALALGERP
jgi:hypothetical protein